ncbi:hypothetical protein Chor_005240 [Crotalus horridus]
MPVSCVTSQHPASPPSRRRSTSTSSSSSSSSSSTSSSSSSQSSSRSHRTSSYHRTGSYSRSPQPQVFPVPQQDQAVLSRRLSGRAPTLQVAVDRAGLALRLSTQIQPKLTPQEKLKLRMQKALNRQFKADKKAAQEKMMQQEHERQVSWKPTDWPSAVAELARAHCKIQLQLLLDLRL